MSSVNELLYTFDLPIRYKELDFYPVVMQDYFNFMFLSQCLMLEKNSIDNPVLAVKYISMSYYEFMLSMTTNENRYAYLFDGLLRLVLKKPDMQAEYKLDQNKKPIFMIDNVVYDSSDFDNIRKLIAEQNMLDIPDEKIQKDVRKKMDEARRYKAKLQGNLMGGLEDQMLALAIYTGWSMDDIYKLTVRKFIKAIHRANHILTQKIYLQASMSGMVEFKDKSIIKSWLADIESQNKNSDVIMELDELKKKVV